MCEQYVLIAASTWWIETEHGNENEVLKILNANSGEKKYEKKRGDTDFKNVP